MGAGILPTTIHNNKLYFLFGKENQYADTPGWSDIGGGTDNKESFLETASREGMEELTGFLGMEKDIRALLTKHGSYKVDFGDSNRRYRVHIFPMKYDPNLPVYYNNNHRFLERKLSKNLIKNSKIFEKEEIKWIEVNQIPKMRSQFRHYFRDVADQIYNEQNKIKAFIRKSNRRKKRTVKKAPKRRGKKTLRKKN
jgi:8-oxo-dGTP pyrophosphatase MutT (NUDIX family)